VFNDQVGAIVELKLRPGTIVEKPGIVVLKVAVFENIAFVILLNLRDSTTC
jgi:hypothetical protein